MNYKGRDINKNCRTLRITISGGAGHNDCDSHNGFQELYDLGYVST